MSTVLITVLLGVLAFLVIGGTLLMLLDRIVVEHHTLSTRDLPNIAASDSRTAETETASVRHPGGAR